MSQITKKALAASLKKLSNQKSLNKITVKEIVEDCGVNRQTFYYHFQNIYALVGWIFITEITDAINGKDTYETWQQGFFQTFKYIEKNKSFVQNTYSSIGREHLERCLYDEVFQLLINNINLQAKGMDVTEEDKKFIADFYKYVFVGIILEWIGTDMKENPDDIIEKLDIMVCDNIKKALIKYEKKQFY